MDLSATNYRVNIGSPRVEWVARGNRRCLEFWFDAHLSSIGAERAIEAWRAAFESRPNERITVVWHCLKMKGYDTEARSQWTATLKDLKGQIESIWLVTDSKFIRMGATVMGMLSSLDIQTVKLFGWVESIRNRSPRTLINKNQYSCMVEERVKFLIQVYHWKQSITDDAFLHWNSNNN